MGEKGEVRGEEEVGDEEGENGQRLTAHILSQVQELKILEICVENARMASRERVPVCQDTGVTVVFLEAGQDLHLTGGDLYEAVSEGVRRGYDKGFLRKSVAADPLFTRTNTGDNTPPLIYTDIVPGDKLRITVVPKGAGSENMSRLEMLTPAAGAEGVKRFIVETIDRAGSNPCPPVIVGVGVGGMMERAALLAKKALLRSVGRPNPQAEVAEFEREVLAELNKLGIGPQGLGGRVTALAVHVETSPTHIAALPVAVNPVPRRSPRRAGALALSEGR